jgi:hypothetical protein
MRRREQNLEPAPFCVTMESMKNAIRILVAILAITFAWVAPAAAKGPHNLSYRNVTVLQGNPILLRDMASLDYQYRIYQSASPYLRHNYLGFSLKPSLSPGFLRVGGTLEIAPFSVARFGIGFEHVNYFGNFGLLQSFPTPEADYSDTMRSERSSNDQNYPASGNEVVFTTVVQNRFGPVIVRDSFELRRVSYSLATGDDFYYAPVLDMLMPETGFGFTNDADVLYISPFGFIVGVRYTITKAFYPDGVSDPNGPTHRLGPSLSYVVFQNPGAAFDSATVFVLLNWWLKHRFRTGTDVNGAFPFLSVGFSITGEIL